MGRACYGGKGFTVDVQEPDRAESALEEASQRPALDATEKEKLETFLYQLFFDVLYPTSIEVDPVRRERLLSQLRGEIPGVEGESNHPTLPDPPLVNEYYSRGLNLLDDVDGFQNLIRYKRVYQYFDGEEPKDAELLYRQGVELLSRNHPRGVGKLSKFILESQHPVIKITLLDILCRG